jgi:hypothetical protein
LISINADAALGFTIRYLAPESGLHPIAWKIRTRDEILFMLNKLGLYLRRKLANGSFSYCMYWEE